MCVLICTEDAYHANTRRHRQEEGSSPTDSRSDPHRFKRWPHHVCGVALYSMCHFALRVDSGGSPTVSRGGPIDSRGGPHHACGVALCSVWGMDSRGGPHRFKRWPPTTCMVWHLVPFRIRRMLARSWDTSSSSRHQAYSAGRRYDRAINKSDSAGDMSA